MQAFILLVLEDASHSFTTGGSTRTSTKNLAGIFYYNGERTEVLPWGKNTERKKKNLRIVKQ